MPHSQSDHSLQGLSHNILINQFGLQLAGFMLYNSGGIRFNGMYVCMYVGECVFVCMCICAKSSLVSHISEQKKVTAARWKNESFRVICLCVCMHVCMYVGECVFVSWVE